MVATAHYLATDAGRRMLADGGNAIDAAVAASLALGVCEPHASGIGGMATMVIHVAAEGRTFTIGGPCRAPELATPESVADHSRRRGYRAVAVPGGLAAIDAALSRYGTMTAAQALAPAIAIAEEGFRLGNAYHELAAPRRRTLRRDTAAPFFLDSDRQLFAHGHLLRQPKLAATMRRLADAGLRDFYEGSIATEIDRDMVEHGGYVRASDLAAIGVPGDGATVSAEIDGAVVHTVPPPGGGTTVLRMIAMQAALPAELQNPATEAGAVALAANIQLARRERRRTGGGAPGDPHPPSLGSEQVAADAEEIQQRASGAGETSHISVVDSAGNAVSLTQSLERVFGAKVAHPELGFLYNGYLRAFKVRNRSHPHFLRPGTPARSNAAPSVILREGWVHTVIGSTGSERLASSIVQVLARVHHMTPFEAVHAPRLHATPEGTVLAEERLDPAIIDALRAAGFAVEQMPAYAFAMGGVQLVTTIRNGYVGVADPRRDGFAGGP